MRTRNITNITVSIIFLIILYFDFGVLGRRGFGISGGFSAYRSTSALRARFQGSPVKGITNTAATKDKQPINTIQATNSTPAENVAPNTNSTKDKDATKVINVSVAPWHVGLYTKTTSPYMQICGGTIITKNVVVTAAHCISRDRKFPPADIFAVAAGKVYRPWNDPNDVGAQKSDVDQIKIPPRYQGAVSNFQEDIALLILTKEFEYNEFVRPACVNFNPHFDTKQLEDNVGGIVGWGLTGENSLPAQVLQAAELPIVAIDKCIEEIPASFRSFITGDKICAGHTNGTAVCRGDSGGGLTIPGIVKRANIDPPCFELHVFLRGVVSTSPTSDESCNIYAWATFTHLLRHEHFLKSVVPDVGDSCIPLKVYKENELQAS